MGVVATPTVNLLCHLKERQEEDYAGYAPLLSEGLGEALEAMLSDRRNNAFGLLELCIQIAGAMLSYS